MKHIIKQSSMATILMVLIMGSASSLSHPKGPEHLKSALDLTSEQQQQFDAIHSEKRALREKMKNEHKEMQNKTRQLLLNYTPEKAELLAQEIAMKAKTKSLKRFEHMSKVMAILTEEQKQKFLRIIERQSKQKAKHGKR